MALYSSGNATTWPDINVIIGIVSGCWAPVGLTSAGVGAGPVGTAVAAGGAVPDVICCVLAAFDGAEPELAGCEEGDGAAAADGLLPANDDDIISVHGQNDLKHQATS
jgi:hypothetical protein